MARKNTGLCFLALVTGLPYPDRGISAECHLLPLPVQPVSVAPDLPAGRLDLDHQAVPVCDLVAPLSWLQALNRRIGECHPYHLPAAPCGPTDGPTRNVIHPSWGQWWGQSSRICRDVARSVGAGISQGKAISGGLRALLGHPGMPCYFPMQNEAKIFPSKSSAVTSPVISPRARCACRSSSATSSPWRASNCARA